jgi:SARP family transcriptional regulator, regulator of embCAB operon
VIEVNILGSIAITHDGREFDVSSRRIRTVLALLALSRRMPVPFDALMDELWRDKLPGNARNALQATLVRLRRLLTLATGEPGDRLVRTVAGGYLLDVPVDAVDANRFLDLAEHGSRQVDQDPELAVTLLARALELWRGPALSGAAGGLRCQIAAAGLDERRLSARADLVTARLRRGDTRAVLPELWELTATYPEREQFTEQLMLALYRSGRQTEALKAFHRVRDRLAGEQGLEPGRRLRRLYQEILVHNGAMR